MSPFLINLVKSYGAEALMGVAVVGLITTAVLYVRHGATVAEQQAEKVRELTTYRAANEKTQQMAVQLEQKLAEQQTLNQQLTERLTDETRKPVYSTCKLPADGLRLYNDAIRGASAR